MIYLQCKFLGVEQLPANDPYPPSTLVSLLVGKETMNLVGDEGLFAHLEKVADFTPILFEVRPTKIHLPSLGGSGKGNAYRLRLIRPVDPKEISS